MTKLDLFLLRSWGHCAAYDMGVNLPVSRVCPLAREVYELLGQAQGVPPSFQCTCYQEKDCPAESWVLDAALTQASPQS